MAHPILCVQTAGHNIQQHNWKDVPTQWEFEHETSSPGNPQSNMKAESAVKITKRLMGRAKRTGHAYLTLLDHSSPHSSGLHSISTQKLMGKEPGGYFP